MSFISNLWNTAKTTITHPVQSFLTGSTVVASALAHPVTFVTQGPSKALEQTSKGSLSGNIARIVTTGALAAGAVVGAEAAAGAVAARGVAGAAGAAIRGVTTSAASFAVHNPKSAVALGVIGPTLVGVLASSPSARNVAQNLISPGANVERGQGIGGWFENKTPEQQKAIGELALGVGAGLAGAAIAGGVALANSTGSDGVSSSSTQLVPTSQIAGGSSLPSSTGVANIPQSGTSEVSVLQKNKNAVARRQKQQPIRISNRVIVNNSNRNIYKRSYIG